MPIRTSKSLTILGILTIVGAVVAAATALVQGNTPEWGGIGTAVMTGIGMIMAKGQASTGGTVPETPEAMERVQRGFGHVGLITLIGSMSLLALVLGPRFARAEDAATGPLPQLAVCVYDGALCAQPTAAIIPTAIDVHSGKVSPAVAVGFGYALVFQHALREGYRPSVNFLFGVQTSGNWTGAVMGGVGAVEGGPKISHRNGVNYLEIAGGLRF